MKAAIANAVTAYAQAAAHRHPRCVPASGVTPPSGAPSADLATAQSARILELHGELAGARARIVDLEERSHRYANRVTAAEGAMRLIALELGLAEDAEPLPILAAIRRLR